MKKLIGFFILGLVFLLGNAWAGNDNLSLTGNLNAANIVAKTADAKIFPVTGKLLWKSKPSSKGITSWVMGEDGTLYLASNPFQGDGHDYQYLYAVGTDGQEKWAIKLENRISVPPVVGKNGWAYFSCHNSTNPYRPYFYAVSPDGGIKYETDSIGEFVGLDFEFYPLFNVPTWDPKWGIVDYYSLASMKADNPPYATPNWSIKVRLADYTWSNGNFSSKWSMGPNGEMYGIYNFLVPISGSSKYLDFMGIEAFDRFGIYLWNYKVTEETRLTDGRVQRTGLFVPPVVDREGNLYFGATNNIVYALNKNGELLWSNDLGIIQPDRKDNLFYDGFWISPILGDGLVYFSSVSGRIYAFSTKNGDIIWETKIENTANNPILLGNDGILYVSGIYAFNAKTGEEKGTCAWVYKSEATGNFMVSIAPQIITPAGIWYFYLSGYIFGESPSIGYLCALDTNGEHGLAQTAWPMEGANPQKTFRPNPKPVVVNVKVDERSLPKAFSLGNAFPNPFNPSTTIPYTLAKNGEVKIIVYNASGQKMAVLVDEKQSAGKHSAVWNASRFSSGLYFYTLQTADGISEAKKVVLLK